MQAWAVIHRSVEAMRFARVAALCCSCTDDGWVCARVQHLQGQEDALQARECNPLDFEMQWNSTKKQQGRRCVRRPGRRWPGSSEVARVMDEIHR